MVTGMVIAQNSEVISDSFNVDRSCTHVIDSSQMEDTDTTTTTTTITNSNSNNKFTVKTNLS
jgi:hypothetical protein